MAQIIDGRAVAAFVKNRAKNEVEALKKQNIDICLAVILVGNDPASCVYVANKRKDCDELGIKSVEYALGEDTTMEELLCLIDKLNNDKEINGILCQLPLPRHLDETKVIEAISPIKDVDAFHNENVGKIMTGKYEFLPCTPAGIMEMLSYYNIDSKGQNCVVIGRSNIVGKPMAMLMLHSNATVTICHSKTKNLAEVCKNADILISAVGKADFVTADMVKDGAIVIDVGMNRNSEGKLCGDVDYEGVKDKCSMITPVPGGVGPMTRAMLMCNTVTAAKKQNGI
ncbi:MAG: bifunctional methylenetetrahydrofolate dehydrogenase/methenyltetrahydrofolate cyclohydrolase FolD [Acutalibacteraceae bacterium]|nr:bifunctional methylenetetrahydrofolate dehydrogenase/methenyltetrahydrofolate cyclohydrolase FolD [Acutalibacteraceae bacterium]